MGFPTRERNSSHASSSDGPAQRKTMSLSGKDEYRVGLEALAIVSSLVRVMSAESVELMGSETNEARREVEL
jgi:hypothetical protein